MRYMFTVTDTSITIIDRESGFPFQMRSTHKYFQDLVDATEAKDEDAIEKIVDRAQKIVHILESVGAVCLYRSHVEYKGEPIHGYLVTKIVERSKQGLDVTPMLNFLNNLMDNPSKRTRDDLFRFLERSGLPITPDGNFMAYRMVTDDFRDLHTRSMDNSPGEIVSMPRNLVDDDITRTCSSGLHACGPGYLPNAYPSDGKVVLVEINPKDVVAFPNDYHLHKLRCCEFKVICELLVENPAAFFKSQSFVFDGSTEYLRADTNNPHDDEFGVTGDADRNT